MEMVVEFCRSEPPLQPLIIHVVDIEVVQTYKYLGVHLGNKLDWSMNMDALYQKRRRLFFQSRLWSFDVCSEILNMIFQSVVASTLFLLWSTREAA